MAYNEKNRKEACCMYMTRQRRELLQFFRHHPDETFTAQDIAQALASLKTPPVSISAVYRNLSMLEKEGYLLRSPGEKPRESKYRFIHADECANKLHLVCEKCGATIHLDEESARALVRSAIASDGFHIDPTKTTIYGVCRSCRRNGQ